MAALTCCSICRMHECLSAGQNLCASPVEYQLQSHVDNGCLCRTRYEVHSASAAASVAAGKADAEGMESLQLQLCRCEVPLPEDIMTDLGVPLPAATHLKHIMADGLAWNDFQVCPPQAE
jgi:hypothetical protein